MGGLSQRFPLWKRWDHPLQGHSPIHVLRLHNLLPRIHIPPKFILFYPFFVLETWNCTKGALYFSDRVEDLFILKIVLLVCPCSIAVKHCAEETESHMANQDLISGPCIGWKNIPRHMCTQNPDRMENWRKMNCSLTRLHWGMLLSLSPGFIHTYTLWIKLNNVMF